MSDTSPHADPSPRDLLRVGLAVSQFGLGTIDYLADTIVLDERAAKLFDLPSGEPVARSTLHDRIHPDDRPKIDEQVKCLYDEKGDNHIHVEHRVVHTDGTELWLEARKQVEMFDLKKHDRSGPNKGVVAIVDITAHKENENHTRLLMEEMNHRAKNAIGVIQGVVRLMACTDEEKAFSDRLTERLIGLARNQDGLVYENEQKADLKNLINVHLSAFTEQTNDRVFLDGPSLFLSPAAAQSIGMAVHELATNAVKYGALSDTEGTIGVTWHVEDDDTFQLQWSERNGPRVAPPTRKGFGRKVLETIVPASVRGTVELVYKPVGVSWHLKAPLSEIERR